MPGLFLTQGTRRVLFHGRYCKHWRSVPLLRDSGQFVLNFGQKFEGVTGDRASEIQGVMKIGVFRQ